jgi:outer membrane protein assembly factor BamB
MARCVRKIALLSALAVASTMAMATGAGAGGWTTYHHDATRTADATLAGRFHSLTKAWLWGVPQGLAEQDLYGEPLIDNGLVFVTSNANYVYALKASTGKLVWERYLGQPEKTAGTKVCGDVQTTAQPSIGIVSTPVIDDARNEIYVVAAKGIGVGAHLPIRVLYGLNLTTGAIELTHKVEPAGVANPYLLQRAALAEDGSQILIGFGGNDGDCGNYHGWLESTSNSNPRAPVQRFEVSTITGGEQGAIWMGGGAPTIMSNGDVVVADGNGICSDPSNTFDDSDAVLKLTPTMGLSDWFAPADFASENCRDLDLGSGAPQLLSSGLILQIGKTHTGYLLSQSSLGHHLPKKTFPVCKSTYEQDNGGAAVISQTTSQAVLAVPCSDGLEEVTVTGGASPSGSVGWTSVATGPPIMVLSSLGGGDLAAIEGGSLVLINPVTGAIVSTAAIAPVINHFETPAAGDGILVAAGSRYVVAFKPSSS